MAKDMIVIGIDHTNGFTFSKHIIETNASDTTLFELMQIESGSPLDEVLIVSRKTDSDTLELRSLTAEQMSH